MNLLKFSAGLLFLALLSGCSSSHVAPEPGKEPVIDDRQGGTPLFLALLEGDSAKAIRLVAEGRYINQNRSDGVTPLMLAAIKGDDRIAQALVEAGAEVNAVTLSKKYDVRPGLTALMFAAEDGNAWLTQYLVASGADMHHQDEHGMTALMCAVKSKDLLTVQSLAEAGAADYQVTDRNGYTALMIAAHLRLPDIFSYLKRKKIDATAKQFLQ